MPNIWNAQVLDLEQHRAMVLMSSIDFAFKFVPSCRHTLAILCCMIQQGVHLHVHAVLVSELDDQIHSLFRGPDNPMVQHYCWIQCIAIAYTDCRVVCYTR